MTFSFSNFRFLDSFAFLSSSIDKLSSNLTKEQFKYTPDNELLLKKGVYPYEYIDSYDRFNESELPTKDKFYSHLNESGISDDDYKHAQQVWNEFQIKNIGEYHDLYLKTDVLLLSDIFETFRTTALNNYGLDPANGYFTLPNYSWDCMLYNTKIELEQLIDPDMYLFCEQGIRGGISVITERYAKANNKYMKNYNPNEESSYIMYYDANNLYGGAISENLPYKDFEWIENIDIMNYDVDGNKGCFVECDLEYPDELHDLHNDYPLAPERTNVNKNELSNYQLNQLEIHNEKFNEKIEKLIPNLKNKTKYITHIKNLQYYIKKGLKLVKVHRVLQFTQSKWLKKYIDFNTNQRKNCKSDFEKDMYKLMNNAVFGKTMENVRGRVDIQLYTDETLIQKQIAKPQFELAKIYNENLVAIKSLKKMC